MAKDKFDAFMSQYSESNASLDSVVDSGKEPAKHAAPKAAPKERSKRTSQSSRDRRLLKLAM